MPVLSRFYGIVIRMYFQQSEHNPPHFHAIYGEHMAAICINDGTILDLKWFSNGALCTRMSFCRFGKHRSLLLFLRLSKEVFECFIRLKM